MISSITRSVFVVLSFACFALAFLLKGSNAQLGFTPSSGKTYKVGSCNICGGDGYLMNPYHVLENNGDWTCGYAQTTVQDVNPNGHDSERVHCISMALISQEGGCQCSGGNNIQSSFTNPNEACHLCGAGNPVYNQDELTNTGVVGQHQCGSLSQYMLGGGVTLNLCRTIKANSFKDCCTMKINDYQSSISYKSLVFSSSPTSSKPKPEYNTLRQRERISNLRGGSAAAT